MLRPDETLAFRSPLSISLWELYIQMPGLFQLVSHTICHQDEISDMEIQTVSGRVRIFRTKLAAWRGSFDALISEMDPASYNDTTKDVLSSHAAMQGTGLALSIIGNRLLSALSCADSSALEAEAQDFAHKLRKLCGHISPTNPWVGFYLGQKQSVMADSILDTAEIWRNDTGKRRGVIAKWRFESWCRQIPRDTCCSNRSFTSLSQTHTLS